MLRRVLHLGLLLGVVAGALSACVVVPYGYRRAYEAPPPVYGPPAPPPCRWVWVGRWECR
jgi:hypothetical protein